MSVRIVTDSTANLTPELLREHNIVFVPLNVRFGEESFKAGVTLDSAGFFDRLSRSAELPVTSLPAPADFQMVYADLLRDGGEVVSIHLSSKLSGTFGSARTAASEFPGRVRVVDSGHVSGSLFLLVLGAARMAAAGRSADEITAWLDEARSRAQVFFIVETLDYLKRSGRGQTGNFYSGPISLKPILMLREGVLVPCARARTKKKAYARALEFIESRGSSPTEAVVSHAAAPERCAEFASLFQSRFPKTPMHQSTIGPVVGTSSGPGCIAVGVI